MNLTELRKKLQLKPSFAGRIVGAPVYLKRELIEWPAAMLTRRTLNLDYAIVFVRHKADLRKQLPRAVKWVGKAGALWFAYPNKSSGFATDLDRNRGWESLNKLGCKCVRSISIDEDWTALRFRVKG